MLSIQNFWCTIMSAHHTVFHICITIVSFSLCLLIYYFSKPYEPNYDSGKFEIINAIGSRLFRESLIAAVGIGIVPLLEFSTDVFLLKGNQIIFHRASLFNFIQILTFMILNLFILCWICPREDFRGLFVIFQFRVLFLMSISLMFLRQIGGKIWKTPYLIICSVCIALYPPLRSCQLFFGVGNLLTSITGILSIGCMVIASIIFLYISWLWLCEIKRKLDEDELITISEYCCNIYILCIIITVPAATIGHLTFNRGFFNHWDRTNTNFLVFHNGVFTLCAVLTSILYSRTLKVAANLSQEELGFHKLFSQHISYVIHEPLKSITTNLQLLEKDLSLGLTTTTIEDVLISVTDTRLSVTRSVSLLNDLIMFDKLEDKNFRLERRLFSAWDFLSESLEPFFVDAKHNGLEFTVEWIRKPDTPHFHDGEEEEAAAGIVDISSENVIGGSGRNGEDGCCCSARQIQIQIDPSAVTQALENLLHIAIQIVPRGGRLHVCMSHTRESMTGPNLGEISIEITCKCEKKVVLVEEQLFQEVINMGISAISPYDNNYRYGLGIYVAHAIIRAHGGSFTIGPCDDDRSLKLLVNLPVHAIHTRNSLFEDSLYGHRDSCQSQDDVRSKTQHGVLNFFPYISTGMPPSLRLSYTSFSQSSISNCYRIDATYPNTPNSHPDFHFAHLNSFDQLSPTFRLTANRKNFSDYMQTSLFTNSFMMDALRPDTTTSSSSYKRKRVLLLVDDLSLHRKMHIRMLKNHFKCIEATDGLSAVQLVRESLHDSSEKFGEQSSKKEKKEKLVYDVILIDALMPHMDGPTTARNIREIGYKGCIIGLLHFPQTNFAARFLTYGADAVLNKPLSVTELDECVKLIQRPSFDPTRLQNGGADQQNFNKKTSRTDVKMLLEQSEMDSLSEEYVEDDEEEYWNDFEMEFPQPVKASGSASVTTASVNSDTSHSMNANRVSVEYPKMNTIRELLEVDTNPTSADCKDGYEDVPADGADLLKHLEEISKERLFLVEDQNENRHEAESIQKNDHLMDVNGPIHIVNRSKLRLYLVYTEILQMQGRSSECIKLLENIIQTLPLYSVEKAQVSSIDDAVPENDRIVFSSLELQEYLILCRHRLGCIYKSCGDPLNAEINLSIALTLMNELKSEECTSFDYVDIKGSVLRLLSCIFVEAGKEELALVLDKEAIELSIPCESDNSNTTTPSAPRFDVPRNQITDFWAL